MKDQAALRRISIICLIAALVMFVVHVQILVMFNQTGQTVQGNDSTAGAYMNIDFRGNSTSRWEKRDFPLSEDQTVNLIGQTVDGVLANNSGDTIQDWSLRINITGDCFVNQAWTGEMEIHQFVGTDREAVQQLNLQDYRLEDITLQYRYDGDLLIPLQKGDYILYHPNLHNMEMPLKNKETVTIGMIFYYLGDLDLSDYTLNMHFHRDFTQGWSFFAFIALAFLWFLSAVICGTSAYAYRNARKQLEMRKSGLSSMSELYKVIYIVNLPADELTPVSASDYLEQLRPKYAGAKELLVNAIREDAAEAYLEAAVSFVNLDTLPERLKDRDSVVCEFFGKNYGWCSIRFFAMDRAEGNLLENVIFTVQDINEDRTEMQKTADRLAEAESVSLANRAFLSGASRDLREPVRELLALDERLLGETDPEKIRAHAWSIHGLAERMLLLIDGMADRASLEAGAVRPAAEPYSLSRLIREVFSASRPAAESRGIPLDLEVTESIPDELLGDAPRLKEVIVSLMAGALRCGGQGSVKLSVFGRILEEKVHLLFSVRFAPEDPVSAGSLPEGETGGPRPGLDLEIARSLLSCLSSDLKFVPSADAWQEVYFELDQVIANPAPVGPITAEEMNR